ncbi:hypothetical protein GCM10007423_34410 [Dyadobacter endophyticus]|uniref:Uncharacterized protein n=1 Tax=Dyadobacter endophyticus TaxID=1749036 RepID=A0ABQ1YWT5_9BACT|nr:hypothetical protein [Dyadobacter endophyticus]GGH39796.1 hypothetical protein GCM10007423_34410 [Dyadobacter endophyticus]
MDQPVYDVKVLEEGCRFDFLSIGYTATHKAILYKETEIPFLYSLTLAEVQWDGKLSARINNSNADVKPTMATVFNTIETFTTANPRAIVGFTGNTDAKTRLYRIAISRDLDKFLGKYMIWGVRSDNGKREPFEPNQPYQFFFVTSRFLI